MPSKMKPTLNVTLSFGMVNIPVGLAPATTEKELVKFKLLHTNCGTPIKTQKVCPECDMLLDTDDIVRGYELAKNTFLRVENDEYESIRKARQPLVRINNFVPWSHTGGIARKRSYWLIPNTELSESYSLLGTAMAECEADAFGHCNLWGKDGLFLVTIHGGLLMLHLLHSQAELVEPDFAVPNAEDGPELKMAKQIVKGSLWTIDPEFDLRNEDEEAMADLIEAKKQGLGFDKPLPEAPIPATVDLLAALKASLPKKSKKVAA